MVQNNAGFFIVALNMADQLMVNGLLNVHKIIFRDLSEPLLHMWLLPVLFQPITGI